MGVKFISQMNKNNLFKFYPRIDFTLVKVGSNKISRVFYLYSFFASKKRFKRSMSQKGDCKWLNKLLANTLLPPLFKLLPICFSLILLLSI